MVGELQISSFDCGFFVLLLLALQLHHLWKYIVELLNDLTLKK